MVNRAQRTIRGRTAPRHSCSVLQQDSSALCRDTQVDSFLSFTNDRLKACWLGSSVKRFSHNPPRDPESGAPLGKDPAECEKMDRFVFMGDCSTSLDGEIAADGSGFTIIFNAHQQGRYPEDEAFHGPTWKTGRFIPFSLFTLASEYYIQLANWRAREHYTAWPPVSVMAKSQQTQG
jgi:hypothetical protein